MDIAVNWVAVAVAALANMALGFLWFGPLCGKRWKALMGFTDEGMKAMKMTPAGATVGGLIAALVMAYVLNYSIVFANAFYGTVGAVNGLMAGLWNWIGFVAPITVGMVLWEGKPWKLWYIVSGYWLIALLVMGAIIGAWA